MLWMMLVKQYLFFLIFFSLSIVAGVLAYRSQLTDKSAGRPVVDIGEECALGARETQEDAGGAVVTAWGMLTVLADGMGKGQAGKTAALATVRTLLALFSDHDVTGNLTYFFTQAFNRCNKEVLNHLQGARGGTAMAAVIISKGQLYYASVGDIRIAALRNKELIQINKGHTMKTAAVKGYEKGILTREQAVAMSKVDRQINYVGRDGFKNIEIGLEPVKLTPGDVIVLMNKGIHKYLSWVELERILAQPYSCQNLAQRVIEAFNLKPVPDKDSASLFVLRYNGT